MLTIHIIFFLSPETNHFQEPAFPILDLKLDLNTMRHLIADLFNSLCAKLFQAESVFGLLGSRYAAALGDLIHT